MPTPYNYHISPLLRIFARILILGGLMLLGVGILRLESVPHEQENNLLVLVDTSRSMSVEDIVSSGGVIHSRLDAAKLLLMALSDRTPHALMTFTDSSRLQLPLSDDTALWRSVVATLAPTTGAQATDIEGALANVASIYSDTPLSVVLITDGESTLASLSGVRLPDALRVALVGIGTEDGGKIVDHYDGDGNIVYKTFQGKEVISRLDLVGLSRLQDRYRAPLFTLHKTEDIQRVSESIRSLTSPVIRPISLDLILILGVLGILIGLVLPDYRLK